MNDITKIAAVVVALGVLLGTAWKLDCRWVRADVYAEEMSTVQMRQVKHEQRQVEADIDNLKDRIASPTIPDSRKIIYMERLRRKEADLVEIKEEKETIKKGGK
jgi:hypothetical protein